MQVELVVSVVKYCQTNDSLTACQCKMFAFDDVSFVEQFFSLFVSLVVN